MSRVRDLADNNVVFVDGITTADITEHTNLFFTDARADARLALKMVDEDNMSSNSAAHMPTQQSVKAYVDTEVASLVDSSPSTLDTLNELAAALGDDANFSTTITNSIATKLPLSGGTLTGNVTFGDNNKAIFGAGSDLQIYHDSSVPKSVISEQGGGPLELRTSQLNMTTADGSSDILRANASSVKLYGNNAVVLNATSTGIDVTGTVTSDGLTVDGDAVIQDATPTLEFKDTDNNLIASIAGASGSLLLKADTGSGTSSESMQFHTGGSEAMRIDSSGNVGIGVVPQSFSPLMVNTATDRNISVFDNAAGATIGGITNAGASAGLRLAGYPLVMTGGGGSGAEHMRIDSSGNLILKATSDTGIRLQINGADETSELLEIGITSGHAQLTATHASGGSGAAGFIFRTRNGTAGTNEKMRLDASGALLVGTTDSTPYNNSAGSTADNGIALGATGIISSAKYNDATINLNRTGTDGDIAIFRKDGSIVGSIGVDNTDNLTISGNSGHCGLNFSTDDVNPYKNGAYTNGTTNLGSNTTRFNDLRLSGEVNLQDGSTSWRGLKGSNLGYGNGSYKVTQVGASSGTNNIALGVDLSGNTSGAFTGYRDIFVSNDAGLYQPNSTNDSYHQLMGWDDNETVFNDSHGNRDFRVESDSNTHALFVNGEGAGSTNVGTADNVFGGADRYGVNIFTSGQMNMSCNATILQYLNIENLSGTQQAMMFYADRSNIGNISFSSSGITYNTTSDRRLKDNIEPIADATDKLMDMKPVTHTWIDNPDEPQVHGFIAQEMQEVVPEAVSGDAESDEMMSMDYGRITPVIVAALQDALNEIKELKTRINVLENK